MSNTDAQVIVHDETLTLTLGANIENKAISVPKNVEVFSATVGSPGSTPKLGNFGIVRQSTRTGITNAFSPLASPNTDAGFGATATPAGLVRSISNTPFQVKRAGTLERLGLRFPQSLLSSGPGVQTGLGPDATKLVVLKSGSLHERVLATEAPTVTAAGAESWPIRFFVLTPKRLCYFTDSVAAANFEKIGKEMSAKLADVLIHRFVMLNEASVDISSVDVNNHPHTFRVVTTESTLTLAAADVAERDSWCSSIQTEISTVRVVATPTDAPKNILKTTSLFPDRDETTTGHIDVKSASIQPAEEKHAAEDKLAAAEQKEAAEDKKSIQVEQAEERIQSDTLEVAQKQFEHRLASMKLEETNRAVIISEFEKQAKGTSFLKHGRSGAPHDRVVSIDANGIISWTSGSMSLADVYEITAGKTTKVFSRAESIPDTLCFSVVAKDRTLDLQAGSEQQRDLWVTNLRRMSMLFRR